MDNEDDSPEVIRRKWNYRVEHWKDILKEQFQLSYYGTIPYESSQSMTISEREYFFSLLIEQKGEELKSKKNAIAQAKQNSK